MILLIFLVISILSSISCQNNCRCQFHTKIGAEVDEVVIESENYPNPHCINGSCLWEIEPHSEKDLRLDILDIDLSVNASLAMLIDLYTPNKERIPVTIARHGHDAQPDDYHRNFQLPKNTGMMLKFSSKDKLSQARGFKVLMKRVENNNSSCSQTYSDITEQQHFIEKTGPLNVSCYYLTWRNETIPDEKVLYVFDKMKESRVWLFHFDDSKKPVRQTIYHNTAFLVNTGGQMIQIHKNLDKLSYTRPTITAQIVGQKCNCGKPEYYFPNNDRLVLKSPGWPNISCPSLSCQTTILANVRNLEDGMIDIILFNLNIALYNTDSFEIRKAGEILFKAKPSSSSTIMIASSYENHVINYRTENNANMRYYDLNVSRITVHKECNNDLFTQKKTVNDFTLTWNISSKCDFVYRYRHLELPKFLENQSHKMILRFYVENPNLHDRFTIITDNSEKEFKYQDFNYKQYFSTSDKNVRILFTRFARGTLVREKTNLWVQWRIEKILNCEKEIKVIKLGTTPFVLASRDWPDTYRNNEQCRYLFSAPENHTIHVLIDQIRLARHRDKLQFYQGNTTGGVSKTFTGVHDKIEFDMESREMVIEFTTDGGTVDAGFHINLVAVKRGNTPTDKPLPTIPSDDESEQLIEDDILVQELIDSEKILSKPDGLEHTEVPENMKIPTGNLTGSSWIFVICLIFILIAGMLVYKYRYSIRSQIQGGY